MEKNDKNLLIRVSASFKEDLERLATSRGFTTSGDNANISKMIRDDYQEKIDIIKQAVLSQDESFGEMKEEFIPHMAYLFDDLLESQKDIINSDEYNGASDDVAYKVMEFIFSYVLTNQDAMLSTFNKWKLEKQKIIHKSRKN